MKEIESIADVEQMVDTFYDQVKNDDLIGPIFNNVVQDWAAHLPTMYRFWGSILLGTNDYRGQPFPKHMKLDIGKAHFDRWLSIFHENIDRQFTGAVAEEAKHRATSIGNIFRMKIDLLKGSK